MKADKIDGGTDLYRLKTEDGVEVRKLYIKLLDPCVGTEEVKFLLSIYGPIEAIKIFRKDEHCGWKMRNRGFVTFKKACNASCALINRKKFSELFLLLPADTWHQPEYQNENLNVASAENSTEEKSSILAALNEDCLLHIITFLDVLDVILLRKVCTKFSELGEAHFKSIKSLDFANIKFKKKLTLHETKLVLETVGHNISKASINSEKFYNQRFLSLIPKFLINVNHLRLTGFKLESSPFWDQMGKLLPVLETLDLSDNSEINENFLKSLKKASSNLKALNVSNCNVNGDFLKLLPFLPSLNISGCRYINGKHLIKFVEANQVIKSLNISKCPNVFGKDVNELLQKSLQLEFLSLNNYYVDDETSRFVIPSINPLINLRELTIHNINFPPCDQLLRTINLQNRIEVLNISYGNLTLTSVYAISTMKRLKKFIMNFKNSVPEDLIDYLMELEHLEEVHVSGCSYISPANILRLFMLPKLTFLDISRCYGFNNAFVVEAAERLLEIGVKKRLQMLVGQTEIDQRVLKELKLREARALLEINWKVTKDVEHDYDIDEENNRSETINREEYFTIDGNFPMIPRFA